MPRTSIQDVHLQTLEPLEDAATDADAAHTGARRHTKLAATS